MADTGVEGDFSLPFIAILLLGGAMQGRRMTKPMRAAHYTWGGVCTLGSVCGKKGFAGKTERWINFGARGDLRT